MLELELGLGSRDSPGPRPGHLVLAQALAPPLVAARHVVATTKSWSLAW